MTAYPVRVTARPDSPSRWQWLVKWLLLVPHYIILAVLWVAFVVLTAVAYVAVLFTGRYPHAVFDFNVGVLRWTWRVGYYGYWVLGTDRYPPFTLSDVADYPARLEIDGPPSPKRWLPLVAWLFALPHVVLVTALTTGATWAATAENNARYTAPGVAGFAVLIAGLALLFTGRYPRGLYDLLVGAWRWYLRVGAYVALLTERYPPLRLDLGADEPDGSPDEPPSAGAAPPRPFVGTAGGVVALVAGVLLVLTGGGLAVGGGAVLSLDAARDRDGYVTSRTLDLSTGTAAVTAGGIEMHPGAFAGRRSTGLDAVRITATRSGDAPLFLGIATGRDVDAWLAGTAHDEVTGMYGMTSARYHRVTGVVQPVTSPVEQEFWLAKATGTGTVTLDWVPGDGRFAVVLANAGGSPGVTADVAVAAKVPALWPIGWGLLGSGIAALLFAALLVFIGAAGLGGSATTRDGPHDGPPPPTTPTPPTGPSQEPAQPPVLTGG